MKHERIVDVMNTNTVNAVKHAEFLRSAATHVGHQSRAATFTNRKREANRLACRKDKQWNSD